MLKTHNPPTIAPPAGAYNHVVEVPPNARWAVLAGQVGITVDGIVPDGFDAQHEQVWKNCLAGLAHVGMSAKDIVRITLYGTDADFIKNVAPVRIKHLGDHRPGSTWLVVKALARPNLLCEMDIIAAKAD